jgi:hypothetical protein
VEKDGPMRILALLSFLSFGLFAVTVILWIGSYRSPGAGARWLRLDEGG